MIDLRKSLERYESDPELLSLLSLHLFEVQDYAARYLKAYGELVSATSVPAADIDRIIESLIDIKIHAENIIGYVSPLPQLVDKFVDRLEPETGRVTGPDWPP